MSTTISSTFSLGLNQNFISIPQYLLDTSTILYVNPILGFDSNVTITYSVTPLLPTPSSVAWSGSISIDSNPISPPGNTGIDINPMNTVSTYGSSGSACYFLLTFLGSSGSVSSSVPLVIEVTPGFEYDYGVGITYMDTYVSIFSMAANTTVYFNLELYPVALASYPNSVSVAAPGIFGSGGGADSYFTFTLSTSSGVGPGFTQDLPAYYSFSINAHSDAPADTYLFAITTEDSYQPDNPLAPLIHFAGLIINVT
jgi:hypothetical protein